MVAKCVEFIGVPVVLAIVALTFTPSEITAILGGIALLIGAIATAAVSIIGAVKGLRATVDTVEKKVSAVVDKNDEVLKTTKTIEGHVNSATAKSDAIIASQETQMAMLRQTIADQKAREDLRAQADNIRSASATVVAKVATEAVPAESLKNITAAIEKNTARTDQTVQDLKDKG